MLVSTDERVAPPCTCLPEQWRTLKHKTHVTRWTVDANNHVPQTSGDFALLLASTLDAGTLP